MLLNKKKIIWLSLAMLLLLLTSVVVSKKISPISLKFWGEINNSAGVAVQGYDVVNYHVNNDAIKGKPEYQVVWHNVKWNFANEDNKQFFLQTPEKYAPQYGGYCSFAVSKGVTANSDAQVWLVKNSKLYLFMDGDVKAQWLQEEGVIASDRNWHN